MKELRISPIKNGTVIDHIPTQSVFQVINILGLNECDNQILFAANLERTVVHFHRVVFQLRRQMNGPVASMTGALSHDCNDRTTM